MSGEMYPEDKKPPETGAGPVAPPVVVVKPESTLKITETQGEQSDTTMAVMTKMFIGIALGPKFAPIQARYGLPSDPIVLSLFFTGAVHKLHDILKKATGWTWL